MVAGTDEVMPNSRAKQAPFEEGTGFQIVTIEGSGYFFLDFNIEETAKAMIEYLRKVE